MFDPAAERYVSLATFRRDGREVRTPVWIAAFEDGWACFSAGDAGKVKRVRANGRARIAPCNARGVVADDRWLPVDATLVEEQARKEAVYDALRGKYGWQMRTGDVFARLMGRYARRAVIALQAAPE